jgi:hypothetical protein
VLARTRWGNPPGQSGLANLATQPGQGNLQPARAIHAGHLSAGHLYAKNNY